MGTESQVVAKAREASCLFQPRHPLLPKDKGLVPVFQMIAHQDTSFMGRGVLVHL